MSTRGERGQGMSRTQAAHAAYLAGYRNGVAGEGRDPRYTEGVSVRLHNVYMSGYEEGDQGQAPSRRVWVSTGRRPRIGITREGLGELIPYAMTSEDPEGDQGDGSVAATIMEHTELTSDMGMIWDAYLAYDFLADRGRYDVQYVEDEPGCMGWLSVRPPDIGETGEEAAYDIYIMGEDDLDDDELAEKLRREGIQRGAAARRAKSRQTPGLRARRKELGLTQAEAAKGAGIAPNTLSLAERGARVSLATVQGLARALETSVAALTGEDATEDL